MLKELLRITSQQSVVRERDVAQHLGVSERVLAQMLDDLAKRGYLECTQAPCGAPCHGCALSATCAPGGGRLWQVTAKGRAALGPPAAPGRA
jgi:hypothetical protein